MHEKKSKGVLGVPEYPLPEVRKLIEQGRVIIHPNARQDAYNDFGWDTDAVIEALKKLKPGHFHKREVSNRNQWHVYDFYKAYGLCGENVYTHFYIAQDEDNLVINSFKRI